eukprot:2840091-Rhodomonas_salina.1
MATAAVAHAIREADAVGSRIGRVWRARRAWVPAPATLLRAAIVLRVRYGMSGTDVGYAATRSITAVIDAALAVGSLSRAAK